MTTAEAAAPATRADAPGTSGRRPKAIIAAVVAVVVVVLAFTVGTTWVKDGSKLAQGTQAFSAATFAEQNFSKVQDAISKRAVPATTLSAALKANAAAATKKYSVPVSGAPGPEFSVSFTGKVGKGEDGIYPVTVTGVPKSLLIRIQTGPAINGTDLRDATGTYQFGQFTNQIDYQNAAAALNQRMKQEVLAKVNPATLAGKTVSVVGAFQLINPDGWLVTPAKLSVA